MSPRRSLVAVVVCWAIALAGCRSGKAPPALAKAPPPASVAPKPADAGPPTIAVSDSGADHAHHEEDAGTPKTPESISKEAFMKGCMNDASADKFCDCAWKELRKQASPTAIESGTFDQKNLFAQVDKACGKLRPNKP